MAREVGINVYERISPIPPLLGSPKSIRSNALAIMASLIQVASPTIPKVIYISLQKYFS